MERYTRTSTAKLNISIGPGKRKELKMQAVREGKTMQGLVIEIIEAYLQKKEEERGEG